MTERIDNVFNNRALDLVRNLSILSDGLSKQNVFSFKLKRDPFNMIYVVKKKGKELHATVDLGQTQGETRVHKITDIKHIEQLLYFVDEEVPESKNHDRFFDTLTDDYFYYLLEEYAKGEEELTAELLGEAEQLHRYAIAIYSPHSAAVEALKTLDIFMNSDEVNQKDHELLVNRLNSFALDYENYAGGKS